MEPTDDLISDQHLYELWKAKDPEIEIGAMMTVAAHLVADVPHHEWRATIDRLLPRVRRAFHLCGHLEATAAATVASRVLLNAMLHAELELEATEVQAMRTRRIEEPETTDAQRISDVIIEVMKDLETPPPAIPTPFPGLNYYLIGGFRAGELVYLGGRPSVGKSALATELLRQVAMKGTRCLLVSCEMSNRASVRRLLAQQGKLDAASLRSGERVDWEATTATAAKLHAAPIVVSDKAFTVAQIRETVKRRGPFGLILVDYLQNLSGPRQREGKRIEIEQISKDLKALAVEAKAALVVLSSLSRIKDGERPTLASLRESGNLEHDADIVILLHRENDRTEERECLVAKNRDGRTGRVFLNFRPQWLGFEEQTKEEE